MGPSTPFASRCSCYQIGILPPEKIHDSIECSSQIVFRILLRIAFRIFDEFSCVIPWKTEATEHSPTIPASFQCQILNRIRKINSLIFFLGGGADKAIFCGQVCGCPDPPASMFPSKTFKEKLQNSKGSFLGKKREHTLKVLGPDIFQWNGAFHLQGGGD